MATDYTTADDLIAADLPGEDVTLPSGKKIRVRGLSRAELIKHGGPDTPPELVEARHVAACLVHPKITLSQAQKWQAAEPAGGDFKVLSEKIRDLSGLGKDAQKSDVAAVRD